MITLPFSSLPGTSDLFNDYCENHSDIRKFFIGHYTDVLAYETQMSFLAKRTYHRERLTSILYEQNEHFRSGEHTFRNIEKLKSPETFAVVTGQQVGLLTGPLYTIYKALTAVHLADWLKDHFPHHDFVPVFWMETEDHDIEEANQAGILDKQNAYLTLRNGEIDPEVKNYLPVGGMKLGETMQEFFSSLKEALQPTDFSEKLFADLEAVYNPDTTYAEGFAGMMNRLLGDRGIIFVDPSDIRLKQITSTLAQHELETFPTTSEEVIKVSAELEECYHAQVKPRAVNLFYMHNGKRYPVEPSDKGFFLRGTRKRFERHELLELAFEQPELFSPNVLLRPIFQDTLFPTVSYVAGPSEVAYFAQLQPVYDHFQTPMPIIFPRASISIVEGKTMKVFEKYNLPFTAMFSEIEELHQRILMGTDDTDSAVQEFNELKASLFESASKLAAFAQGFDPNLKNPAESTVDNIKQAVEMFEGKLFQMKKQQDEVARNQLEKLLTNMYPDGKPQERAVNVVPFVNKYGNSLLDKIDEFCVPFPSEHRILLL